MHGIDLPKKTDIKPDIVSGRCMDEEDPQAGPAHLFDGGAIPLGVPSGPGFPRAGAEEYDSGYFFPDLRRPVHWVLIPKSVYEKRVLYHRKFSGEPLFFLPAVSSSRPENHVVGFKKDRPIV
jgi:hypothetical protein